MLRTEALEAFHENNSVAFDCCTSYRDGVVGCVRCWAKHRQAIGPTCLNWEVIHRLIQVDPRIFVQNNQCAVVMPTDVAVQDCARSARPDAKIRFVAISAETFRYPSARNIFAIERNPA